MNWCSIHSYSFVCVCACVCLCGRLFVCELQREAWQCCIVLTTSVQHLSTTALCLALHLPKLNGFKNCKFVSHPIKARASASLSDWGPPPSESHPESLWALLPLWTLLPPWTPLPHWLLHFCVAIFHQYKAFHYHMGSFCFHRPSPRLGFRRWSASTLLKTVYYAVVAC